MNEIITIVGPTASGKTTLAAQLAYQLGTEIISADSRQVYRGMDIGTGKDLADYVIEGQNIPYHLIDNCDAGDKYNLFEYQHDFHRVYSQLKARNLVPILCGGTGLYVESVLKGFKLIQVPENKELREALAAKSIDELKEILASYKSLHNKSDFDSVKRAIRAIEIADYTNSQPANITEFEPLNNTVFCINIDREKRRERISKRLKSRLDEGLIDEVKILLNNGIAPDDLIYYGLEYKFVTLYLTGQLTYADLFTQLETAIHQFSKRQMTWFRGMEKRGFNMQYIDYELTLAEKVAFIMEKIKLTY
jgi:tRNA dimethylallyltransferase